MALVVLDKALELRREHDKHLANAIWVMVFGEQKDD